MSGGNLENLVNKLHECLSDSKSIDTETSSIVGNIISNCNENINPQTMANCLSIFFSRERNLLTFLRKTIGRNELRKCKCEILEFMHRFISAVGKQVIQYACEIKNACISMFKSDTYADIRLGTFQIIAKLLEILVGNSDVIARFDLKKLSEDYFSALDRKTQMTGQVKASILKTLGMMCCFHPVEMRIYSKKCLDLFLSNLKYEMNPKNSKPEFNVIAGALEGLSNYLVEHSSTDDDEDDQISKDIFDYVNKALCHRTEDVNRYAMPRAALNLFTKHACNFDKFIYLNYKELFERIKKWAEHKNYDMKKQAYLALDSYYNQLSEMLKKKSKTEPDNCKIIFTEFVKKFYADLTNEKNLDLKDTVIAIKGYGAFAGPCREFMQPKDVKLMFEIIITICERTFFLNMQQDQQIQSQQADIFDEKIYQLPSFIESLSCVCNQIDENISETSINILEKLVILAIDSYPKLIKRYNYQISLAIARLFLSIQMGSQQVFYSEFVSKIVYQSLIRIFSYKTNYFLQQEHQTSNNEESLNEENNSSRVEKNIYNITSSDYILLWSNLLNLNEFKELSRIGINMSEKKKLVQILYDEIIESILKIIKKLDLNSVKINDNESTNESAAFNPNGGGGLKASRPRDFDILVNLVDFSKELLMQKHFNLFEKWIYRFSKEIIQLSSAHSHISGFYRLNTLCMKISIKIDFFKNVNNILNKSFNYEEMTSAEEEQDEDEEEENNDSFNTSIEIDDQFQFEKLNCFYLYKKYIKEIYVRKKQFKDELLTAVLEFFLSLPKELVAANLNQVFEALENSLELGINYLPMADNALNSLEYWIKTIKLNKLKPYYGSILSKFDDYLQMNRVSNFVDESMLKEKTIVLKISYKGSGRKKLPVKLFEKNTKADNSDIYEQIQLRILTILGQLAGEMSHCLFESNQNKQIIAWDTVQHLKFAMPFVDMKPQIDFDRFLSRIIYLSISSTHRQTKVNACELLHAIIIYMIGKSVSDPLNSEKFQMHKIYHHVYPALFKLSCDVDNFARNLFQPLVMQMIHWFTGNRKYESLETIELLNCIMTSLVDEKDAALRDFSAIALKEFLKWSIKHTPLDKQNIEKCSVNAKSILKRIFSFLNHPNCAKRLGATLAWNSIYTVFREEESLVNKYIFELLYNLIESLALAEQDDKMYGTQEQAKLGLDHCERIIRAKADLLNQRNPERNKPPGWSETVLEVAVRWLMRQCGRFETECRHKAMELAYKLSPLLIGNKEAKDYFQNKFQTEGETYFLDRFEGSSNKKDMIKDSLNHFQTLKQLISETGGQFRIALISNWLKILIAPLDCYSWVFSQRLLTPKNLFGNGKSCIWTSLEYFIKNIMNHDLDAVIRNETEMTQSVNIYTPNELEIFRQAKCTAIIRTIDFLVTMISYFPSESFSIVPQTIWCDSFFECILNLCLDPKLIGFNLNDLEIYVNLPLKTRAFFKCFIQNVPSTLLIRIKTMYAQQIAKNKELETIIENILSKTSTNQSIDWIKLSQLITGYEQLSEFNLYQVNLDLNRIIFDFLSNKQTNEEQESLTCVEAKRKLLNLCLSLNLLEIQRSNQLAIIANDYLIELLDKYLFQTNNLHIYQFFSYFKTEICSWICKRVEFITKYVLSKIKLNFARAISLLITLIDYLATDKQIRKQYGTKVVHSIYANWNLFIDYWQPIDSQLDHKALLIDLLTKSILIESINNKEISTSSNDNGRSQVTEMYMHLLTDKKTNLSFKCKILDLLYFFTDSPEPFDIKKYISQFVSDNFPFRSSELTNKENYSKDAVNDYISAVRKILTAIDLCGSVDLIKEISNVCCRETEHICDEDIHACLKRYIRRVDSIKQTNVINIYWDMVFNDSISNEKKSLVFKKILLTFMTNCDKPTFLDFMCKNINNLMNILEIELRENTYELNVLNARIVVELISLAYKRLHKDEIFHPSAKLCQKYEENKNEKDGKKLTKDVLKKCYNYLSEIKFLSIADSNELDRMKSLQYQFHCSAYNCLCSLFMRTQTDPKFYLAFLFKDDPSKGIFIFESLIDSKTQFKFSIEIENVQDRKSKFITLRNEFKETLSDTTNQNYIGSLHSTNTMANNYLNAESMHISSLSEELSIFDFTNNNSSINKDMSFSLSMMGNSSVSSGSSMQSNSYYNFDQSNSNSLDTPIEVESDDLNQHDSMSSLVQLIQSLYINKITPIYEKNQLATEMPLWMQFLHKKVSDVNVETNVKILIVRAIINTQQYFRPYAKFWYAPLVGFIVNTFSKEEIMDYFTLDLMVVLLSWHNVILPTDSNKLIINRLFENLMKRSYHSNRSILKNNLELLKTMTECWTFLIEVPVEIIFNSFFKSTDQKKQAAGIQLIGLVLTNKIENYNYSANDSDGMLFFKQLIDFIKEKTKTIHASAAEVIGMLFKSFESNVIKIEKNKLDDLLLYLMESIKSLLNENSLFITCLHRIQLNYPQITEFFLNKLIYDLPSLYGEFKQMCAECILSSVTKEHENLFIISKNFIDMLKNGDSLLQLVSLKMIFNTLEKQSDENLKRLTPIVCSFVKHSNAACRYQMMDILIKVYQYQSNKISNELRNLVNETLLLVLLDEDQPIRIVAQNFWCEQSNMPTNTIERMVLVLGKMYSPLTENEYLSYSTNLLLEKTSTSPDFKRKIYENPLSECQFREYNLTADWRRRHEIMTPMFVDTINSSLSSDVSSLNVYNDIGTANNYALRATQQQSLQFQATQDILGPIKTAYNWLTQSNVDTLKESLMSASLSDTQSTLLFNNVKKSIYLQTGESNNTNNSADQNITRLRRRFLKDNNQETNKFFARKQIERKNKEEEIKKQLKLKRLGHVEKYRKYRIGDFPDIQIEYRELIAPLQALAQRDSNIAMKLFESLFGSILSEVSYLKNEEDTNLIIKQIQENLNLMLNKSDTYNSNFIACILEIAIKHSKIFRLDLNSISTASLNSFQQSLGIILIEEYLILDELNLNDANESAGPSRKRLKMSENEMMPSDDALLWIELAKLYRSINDYDSIKGIFMRKKNLTTSFTKNGLFYESNNDFYQARQCYQKALDKTDWNEEIIQNEQVFRVEKELWEQFSLRCCNELADWKSMCSISTKNKTESLNDVYSKNSYSCEYIFPYAFKSKLKLILKEDEAEQKKHQDLVHFMQGLDSDDKKCLEQSYCQELALLNLYQKDFNAAKYYSYLAIQKYLMEWSSINQTLVQGRMTKLQSLQPIIELNEFLKFIDNHQTYNSELNKDIDKLLTLWSNTMPNIYSDPPCTWDDVITNRGIYLEFIQDKYFTGTNEEIMFDNNSILVNNDQNLAGEHFEKKMKRINFIMNIKFAQAAQFQGNYKLALNKLEQTQVILKNESHQIADLKIIWNHCYLKTHLARAKFASNDSNKALEIFFKATNLKQIVKYENKNELLMRKELHQENQILHSEFCKFLIDSFMASHNNNTNYFDGLKNDAKQHKQLTEYLKINELNDLKQTVDLLMKKGIESLTEIDHELKGSLELALYCDYFLRLVENEETTQKVLLTETYIKNEYPVMIVKHLLNSIRLNSYEARQRFPRLLKIVELYTNQAIDVFIKSTENIPCWMFLKWLSQMTAILDKPIAKSVYNIVNRIATEYSQAFIYPFQISLESFKFDNDTKEQQTFVDQLKLKMKNQLCIKQFIHALEQLTSPILLFQDYMQQINANAKNHQNLFKIFKEIYLDLFDEPTSESQVEFGIIKKQFSKYIKEKFETEFGTDGKNLTSLSETEIRRSVKKLIEKDLSEYTKLYQTGNLGDFSPWLREFKRNLAKEIEIPGQYNEKSKPMPEYHIKIESFDERISEMVSIRRPKLLTIRGNDQKDHRFLVKGGEDQRQDQRIEILFELINDLLKSDPRCYQRNLSIRTYQVIPMTTKLALIEWISDTKTLKEAINGSKTEEESRRLDSGEKGVAIRYQHYIENASKDLTGRNINDLYGMVYAKYNRDYVSNSFKEIENQVPWDLLRRHIRSMSSSTEGYFYLRNQFIMSYAVASACQYILGIGDRHLGNCMIETMTGKSIPIDFGMAFGHAAINLTVPELVPIRLTRQILKLIAPLEQNGLFEATMLHTLRALRENNDLLMCILDVFIKEPSIDWIGNAAKISKQTLNEAMQFKAGIEYASARIKSVRNKLIGINPCVITRNDLMSGIHKDGKYINYFLEVLMSKDQTDLMRSRLVKENGEFYRLTCEEQVQCIIEQSIDPNLLGRTYNGWAPYY